MKRQLVFRGLTLLILFSLIVQEKAQSKQPVWINEYLNFGWSTVFPLFLKSCRRIISPFRADRIAQTYSKKKNSFFIINMRNIAQGERAELERKPDKHKKCAVCYAKRVGRLMQTDIECQRHENWIMNKLRFLNGESWKGYKRHHNSPHFSELQIIVSWYIQCKLHGNLKSPRPLCSVYLGL